jgi:hypothetical protein
MWSKLKIRNSRKSKLLTVLSKTKVHQLRDQNFGQLKFHIDLDPLFELFWMYVFIQISSKIQHELSHHYTKNCKYLEQPAGKCDKRKNNQKFWK